MIEGIITVALGVALAVWLVVYRVAIASFLWAVMRVVFAFVLFGTLGMLTQFMGP